MLRSSLLVVVYVGCDGGDELKIVEENLLRENEMDYNPVYLKAYKFIFCSFSSPLSVQLTIPHKEVFAKSFQWNTFEEHMNTRNIAEKAGASDKFRVFL